MATKTLIEFFFYIMLKWDFVAAYGFWLVRNCPSGSFSAKGCRHPLLKKRKCMKKACFKYKLTSFSWTRERHRYFLVLLHAASAEKQEGY